MLWIQPINLLKGLCYARNAFFSIACPRDFLAGVLWPPYFIIRYSLFDTEGSPVENSIFTLSVFRLLSSTVSHPASNFSSLQLTPHSTRYASQFTLSLVEGIHEIRRQSANTFYLQNLRKASNIQSIPISQFLIPIPNLILLYMHVVLLTNQKDQFHFSPLIRLCQGKITFSNPLLNPAVKSASIFP